MKRVISISLGSSTRDYGIETDILGEKYIIERIGVNGDYNRFLNMVEELDGRVDAIGMGGINLYLTVDDRVYTIKSAIPLARAARKTPIADGSFVRETLEPQVVYGLKNNGIVDFKGKRAMVTCAVDRYRLAEALVEAGCDIACADLIFVLGIPCVIHSLAGLRRLARVFAPAVTRLPFEMLYPTGHREESVENPVKYSKYYENADIIAGDFNYIKRYMPNDLEDKVIITNTITVENVEELKVRGVSLLVTTTPEFNGRSFGTNVIEAVIVASLGKPPSQISKDEYVQAINNMGFKPRIVKLKDN